METPPKVMAGCPHFCTLLVPFGTQGAPRSRAIQRLRLRLTCGRTAMLLPRAGGKCRWHRRWRAHG
jgi:hypothetical protein